MKKIIIIIAVSLLVLLSVTVASAAGPVAPAGMNGNLVNGPTRDGALGIFLAMGALYLALKLYLSKREREKQYSGD